MPSTKVSNLHQEQLVSIQKQQEASIHSINLLKAQHEEWHRSVEALLTEIRQGINSPNLATPLQPSGGDMEEEDLVPELESVQSSPELLSLEENKVDPVEACFNAELEIAPEAFEESAHRSSFVGQRAGTLDELFRTRKTVVQTSSQPVGLTKIVQEEINAGESEGTMPTTASERLRSLAQKVVDSVWFEYASGLIILVNLITIGIEAEMSLQAGKELGPESWAYTIERIFLIIYCIEAGMRLVAHGMASFKDAWFLMDVTLVTIGLLALLVAPNIGADSMEGVEKLLIVRGLRLLRLVRALRMVNHFKIMWRLVYGLLTAAETILATSALIVVFLFVFACVAVEVISKDATLAEQSQETEFIVTEYFDSLGKTVMTLMQFVTLDSLATIYFPLIVARPVLLCYFLPILVFVSIGLMNLVTAALVENAMEHAAQQAEDEKVRLKAKVRTAMPSLLKIFYAIDKDNSGMVTRDELHNVPMDILPPKVLAAVCVDNWEELFEYLDIDGTGSLSQAEFVEGLLNLCLLDMPIATVQTLKLLQSLRTSVNKLGSQVQKLQANNPQVKLSLWT